MTKEIDYENLRPEDIESEDIELKAAKGAFSGLISCQKCKIKMEKVQTDMDLPDGEITIHLEAYKCQKCGREKLNGKQAEKLDNFMALVDAMKERSGFRFKRAMNFDGNNWFVRFPSELTQNWKKKVEADIVPLTSKDYLIHLRKEKK